MIFRKRETKSQAVAGDERKIGERFAIRYGALSTPVYYEDENIHTWVPVKINLHDLNMGNISDLWTVIEYIGDDQYIDLITGEIIVEQTHVLEIKDTVTREYEDKAVETRRRLLEHPLAIGHTQNYQNGGRSQLTAEIKRSIVEVSMPRQEEIIATVQRKKEDARGFINRMYERKNRDKMHKLYNEALKENERIDIVLESQRREAEAKRQAELRRMEEERKNAEIDPQFSRLFPVSKAKTFIKK